MTRPTIENLLRRLRRWVHAMVWVAVALSTATAPAPVEAASPAPTLRNQIEEVADTHGVVVKGLERLGDEVAKDAEGGERQDLTSLLEGYDYVITDDADGSIEQIVILGPHGTPVAREAFHEDPPPPESSRSTPSEHRIATQRLGDQHQVKTFVSGGQSAGRWVWLAVDSQADTIVLPVSMISQLGFKPEDLSDDWTQTTTGPVDGKRGQITVAVGTIVRRDVAVTFVPDRAVRPDKVLGLSFLGRFYDYRIDELDNQLILVNE